MSCALCLGCSRFWAMEHQLPPEGDWRTWVILGGRGAGKTLGRIGMDPSDGRGQPAQNAGPLRAGGAGRRDFGSSP